jgi:hypothetical protein
MSRTLGATFGRLQTELLTPLLSRAQSILARRGEIADLPIDGRTVVLEYNAAPARYQAQQDAQNTILWLNVVRELGPQGMAVVDQGAAARWLGQALGVPGEIMRGLDETPIEALSVGDLLKSPVIENLAAAAAEAAVPMSKEAGFDKLP